jgi:hypothetical protein
MKMLHRDEFARLGIDTREFGETMWHYLEKPKPRVVKTFFVRTDKEQVIHRSASLVLSCGSGNGMIFALLREVGTSEPMLETSSLTVMGWATSSNAGRSWVSNH